jgi:hypothetical protein
MLSGHLVVADRERQYLEKSFFVRARNARGLGSRVGHSNLHAGDHRTLLVIDGSVNSPSCILSRRQGWRYHHNQREQHHPRKFHGDLRIPEPFALTILPLKRPLKMRVGRWPFSGLSAFPVAVYCFGFDPVFTAAFCTAGRAMSDPCCSSDPRNTLSPFAFSSSQNNWAPLA